MKYQLKQFDQFALAKRKTFRQLLKKLKRQPSKVVDSMIHEAHIKAFNEIDCLKCANCCKTTGPLFTNSDISRIAKKIGLREKEFKQSYLRVDEDGDWVLQTVPCPFLLENNECFIYDFAPTACKTYPHTDMVGQQKIFELTLRNAAICPAVYEILDALS